MSDFYTRLRKYKEDNGLTYSDLGRMISVSGDTFRMGMNREGFSDIRVKKLSEIMKGEQSTDEQTLFIRKENVTFTLDEMITFFILNMKEISFKENKKLKLLIDAINSVENIDNYNNLKEEIAGIKRLLEKNKDFLKS